MLPSNAPGRRSLIQGSAAATLGVLVVPVAGRAETSVPQPIATNLVTAIHTDTGSFRPAVTTNVQNGGAALGRTGGGARMRHEAQRAQAVDLADEVDGTHQRHRDRQGGCEEQSGAGGRETAGHLLRGSGGRHRRKCATRVG